jgi:PadR family transcriptional regulator, regulatory protein PadR
MTELSLYVLLAVANGPAHGYAIGKEIQQRSGGRLDPATGALYQALRRLAEQGLIEQVPAPAEEADERRRYFAITAAGRSAATAEVRRLDSIIALARERHLHPSRAS